MWTSLKISLAALAWAALLAIPAVPVSAQSYTYAGYAYAPYAYGYPGYTYGYPTYGYYPTAGYTYPTAGYTYPASAYSYPGTYPYTYASPYTYYGGTNPAAAVQSSYFGVPATATNAQLMRRYFW